MCKQTPCMCCIHSVSWNKYKEHDRCWDNTFKKNSFKSKASFKGGTRAAVTQDSPASGWPAPPHQNLTRCFCKPISSHLICWGWISFSLLQASLSLGIQVMTLDKTAHPDAAVMQAKAVKHIMLYRHRSLDCCISHGPETKVKLSRGTWSRLRCKAKGFSSWHLPRSRRWRRHWIQPEQRSAGERRTTEFNTHYKLTIDFF